MSTLWFNEAPLLGQQLHGPLSLAATGVDENMSGGLSHPDGAKKGRSWLLTLWRDLDGQKVQRSPKNRLKRPVFLQTSVSFFDCSAQRSLHPAALARSLRYRSQQDNRWLSPLSPAHDITHIKCCLTLKQRWSTTAVKPVCLNMAGENESACGMDLDKCIVKQRNPTLTAASFWMMRPCRIAATPLADLHRSPTPRDRLLGLAHVPAVAGAEAAQVPQVVAVGARPGWGGGMVFRSSWLGGW